MKRVAQILLVAISLTANAQINVQFNKGLNNFTDLVENRTENHVSINSNSVTFKDGSQVALKNTTIRTKGNVINEGSTIVHFDSSLMIYEGYTNMPSPNIVKKWDHNHTIAEVLPTLSRSKDIITIKIDGKVVANGLFKDIKNVYITQGVCDILTNNEPVVENWIVFKPFINSAYVSAN